MKAYINGKEIACEANETILEVARRSGVYIPTLCELHDIDHAPGTCRICLVDRQDGPGGKLETIGGAHARHRGAWGTLESSMLQPSGHARS